MGIYTKIESEDTEFKDIKDNTIFRTKQRNLVTAGSFVAKLSEDIGSKLPSVDSYASNGRILIDKNGDSLYVGYLKNNNANSKFFVEKLNLSTLTITETISTAIFDTTDAVQDKLLYYRQNSQSFAITNDSGNPTQVNILHLNPKIEPASQLYYQKCTTPCISSGFSLIADCDLGGEIVNNSENNVVQAGIMNQDGVDLISKCASSLKIASPNSPSKLATQKHSTILLDSLLVEPSDEFIIVLSINSTTSSSYVKFELSMTTFRLNLHSKFDKICDCESDKLTALYLTRFTFPLFDFDSVNFQGCSGNDCNPRFKNSVMFDSSDPNYPTEKNIRLHKYSATDKLVFTMITRIAKNISPSSTTPPNSENEFVLIYLDYSNEYGYTNRDENNQANAPSDENYYINYKLANDRLRSHINLENLTEHDNSGVAVKGSFALRLFILYKLWYIICMLSKKNI